MFGDDDECDTQAATSSWNSLSDDIKEEFIEKWDETQALKDWLLNMKSKM